MLQLSPKCTSLSLLISTQQQEHPVQFNFTVTHFICTASWLLVNSIVLGVQQIKIMVRWARVCSTNGKRDKCIRNVSRENSRVTDIWTLCRWWSWSIKWLWKERRSSDWIRVAQDWKSNRAQKVLCCIYFVRFSVSSYGCPSFSSIKYLSFIPITIHIAPLWITITQTFPLLPRIALPNFEKIHYSQLFQRWA